MKLNKNSWHVKLAKFYDEDATDEISFCSYFWKTIVKLIFFIPFSIGILFYKINPFIKQRHDDRHLMFLKGYLSLIIVFWMFFLTPIVSGDWRTFCVIPITIILIICILWFIISTYTYFTTHRYSDKPNFFVAGIKSFYNKYCPKIEWDD